MPLKSLPMSMQFPYLASARMRWILAVLWLALLAGFGFLNQLGTLGVMDKTEALFVEVAHQMYLSGDWVTPRWNGETFFDYPVGGYWLVALSFKLFGVSEGAARLPVALAAMAVVIAVWLTLYHWGDSGKPPWPTPQQRWLRASLGAGIMALNPGWIGWGRTAVTDMFLSSTMALTLLCFFGGYAQGPASPRRHGYYLAASVFAAGAVLAKGPVGLLLPGLIIVVFLAYVGQLWVVLREMPLLPMLGIFVLLCFPWYILATQANGIEFLGHFLGFSNFQRFTSVLYRHAGPWYFYLPWCFILLLPWSVFLPLALARLRFWLPALWCSKPRSQQLGLFCVAWFFLVFLFFSAAATKLAGYILPLVPAGALILALFWGEVGQQASTRPLQRWPFLVSAMLNSLLLLLMAVAAFLSPRLVGNDPAYPTFAQTLQNTGLPLGLGGILLLSFGLWLYLASTRSRRRWLWLPNLFGFLATLIGVIPGLVGMMDRERQFPLRQLGQALGQAAHPQEPIWIMGYPRYSFVFYSQHSAVFLDNVDYAWELLEPQRDQTTSPTILMVAEPRFIEAFHLQAGDYHILAQGGTYQLLRVSKQTLLARKP